MLALPAPPPAPARRLLLVGTALAAAAVAMGLGTMLAIYMSEREIIGAGNTIRWVPKSTVINEVAANVLLATMFAASVMAQWAVHAVKRNDRRHAGYALGLTTIFGIAVLTAQTRIWQDLEMVAKKGEYQTLVYAVTGTYAVIIATGVLFAAGAAFRVLGGRTRSDDREVVAANALWWYFLTAATCAVWYFIYVVK